MVVVAIIGILAMVAYPSYQSYIIKTNRAEGKDFLTQVMFEMERFRTRNRTYTVDLVGSGGLGLADNLSENNLYQVTATACLGDIIARCVLLTAVPQGNQSSDGNLTLDSRGRKNAVWDKR